MKKVLLIGAVALLTAGFFAISCSDDNPVSCAQKLVDVGTASTSYTNDPSAATCNAYKDALQDYIDCDGITDVNKTYYQAILDNLDCDAL